MLENERFQKWIDDVDTALVRYFSEKDLSCNPLDRAMEYTLLAGGKRLRPLLTILVCEALEGNAEAALPFALASEFLHTYSLIHDDLPSMDDDEMRRGKPTNHIVFGEANAILAGDALHTEAISLLVSSPHPTLSDARRLLVLSELCEAVGRRGMVAGQVMDLQMANQQVDLDRLHLLHHRKTGGLLKFCVRLGGHLVDADEPMMAALAHYGETIGLLFQVVDDLLDEEATSETLGKTAGKDRQQEKVTFPVLMGAEAAHQYADRLLQRALESLKPLPGGGRNLADIARFIRCRDY